MSEIKIETLAEIETNLDAAKVSFEKGMLGDVKIFAENVIRILKEE